METTRFVDYTPSDAATHFELEDTNTTASMEGKFEKGEIERSELGAESLPQSCYIEIAPFSRQEFEWNIDQPSRRRQYWASAGRLPWMCVPQKSPSFAFQMDENYLGYVNDFVALMSPWPFGIVTATTIATIELIGQATTMKSAPTQVSISEAFQIALGTLKTFRKKWDAYIDQEAKLYSAFDEDNQE